MQSADGTATKASSNVETEKKTPSSDTTNETPNETLNEEVTKSKKTPSSDTANETPNEEVTKSKKTPSSDTANETPNEVVNTSKMIDGLIDGSLQLFELENQKAVTTDELFNSLKIITQFLGFTVHVDPRVFNLSSDTPVTLLPQLDLVFRKANGKTEIKRFDTFSPEILTELLENIIPQIVDMITKEREAISKKIIFLRSTTKQLKQLHNLREVAAEPSPVVAGDQS